VFSNSSRSATAYYRIHRVSSPGREVVEAQRKIPLLPVQRFCPAMKGKIGSNSAEHRRVLVLNQLEAGVLSPAQAVQLAGLGER